MHSAANMTSVACQQNAVNDMTTGFAAFADKVLRGRKSNVILNSSIGAAALEVGVPNISSLASLDVGAALMNNRQFFGGADLAKHPVFDFSAENFTLFGLDFPDMWAQFSGDASEHHTPLFPTSFAEKLGLPDLPYGEMAHFGHMAMALYDTGRSFQDLWNEPALHHNILKITTHPDMLHTAVSWGTMLTVMGLLHPLGMVAAISIAYVSMHLVHGFFGLMENNKESIAQLENVPVLRHIYNATGFPEWVAREQQCEQHAKPLDIIHSNPQFIPDSRVKAMLPEGLIEARLQAKTAA